MVNKVDVDVRGEILELESTITTTVDRLSFAAKVTKVVCEVGSGGRLAGQAEAGGPSGHLEADYAAVRLGRCGRGNATSLRLILVTSP